MAVLEMDRSAAIERNREALKRILLMLVGMAEMAGGGTTLPRHLYRAILLLLRPAESAVRRLIIAAARGIVVTLPPLRPRKPKPKISDTVTAMRRLGLAVNLSKQDFARYEAERKAAERRAGRPRTISLPLDATLLGLRLAALGAANDCDEAAPSRRKQPQQFASRIQAESSFHQHTVNLRLRWRAPAPRLV
jgi:hypothetical protein